MTPVFDLPPTPALHFRAYLLAAIDEVIRGVSGSQGSQDAALGQYPFLQPYQREIASRGFDLAPGERAAGWEEAVEQWEETTHLHLPLRALRRATGLEHAAIRLLLCAGLLEEDSHFGALFEAEQAAPGQRRATVGLLADWWRGCPEDENLRAGVQRLVDLGLLRPINPEAPRLEWAVEVPSLVWDGLRGKASPALAPWAIYKPASELVDAEDLIAIEGVDDPAALAALLASGEVQALLLRGPERSGRRTLLGAVARELDRGVLEIRGLTKPDDERWRLVGVLATLLPVLPVVVLAPGPGESVELPELRGYDGPIGAVLGRQGGLTGAALGRAVTLTLPIPSPTTRRQHWAEALGAAPSADLDALTQRFRMTSGNIRRAGRLARSYSFLAGRDAPVALDVVKASRALHHQSLDNLATPVSVVGDWNDLCVGGDTLRELLALESRCRAREELRASVGPVLARQLTAGVRAMFTGPSGTGKTLAARLLASVLQMDLYRVDLTLVSKWIGETEKNLNQVLSRAEELDVVLLLDEGDALMAPRTGVQTSVDRYANLETNFLLQRLESFEGILIVTTNAPNRIDGAFERRMDVVVGFRPPEALERRTIWEIHLPDRHDVPPALLEELAERCALSGGQIRNAVLHASLLALEQGTALAARHLEEAVLREYRKAGAVCPLRRSPAALVRRA